MVGPLLLKPTHAAYTTVKVAVDEAVPPTVVTETTPLRAPTGTTNVTDVAETTENFATETPPTVIEVTPARFVPVIVILPPTEPNVAAKLVTVGAAAVAE